MERDLKEIIEEICQKLGAENELKDHIIEVLYKKNLYKKLNDVKNIDKEFWKDEDLPMNLFHHLKEEYNKEYNKCQLLESRSEPAPNWQEQNKQNIEFQNLSINDSKNEQHHIQKSQIKEFQNVINNNLINEQFPLLQRQNSQNFQNSSKTNPKNNNNFNLQIRRDLFNLFNEIYLSDVKSKVFNKIYIIIKNIAHHPNEEKYRKFNISKLLSIYNYDGISRFFLNLFDQVDDYMILKEDFQDINLILSQIIKFIKEKKIDVSIDIIDITKDEQKKEINNEVIKTINEPKKINNQTITEINQSININNKPIKGSIEISNNSTKIRYFLYPNITFTSQEENDSKVILLVGKTGDGKTSFINSLVNIYLGIKFEDNFRYLLIKNDNEDQTKSITKEIRVYNIRPKKGLNFPPLKIVDTPGFGDTEGFKEDEKNINNFKKLFEESIYYVNCICYIVKADECRVGFHQKYVFKSIIGLFAENVKENYFVGVTHFIPLSQSAVPNIINNSLSLEQSFYYQYILKNDNEYNRKEILKPFWYFYSDNKIIFDCYIERNEYEKFSYNKTKEQIQNFIEKKINNSINKSIKESANVINNRNQLTVQIEGLKLKLENYLKTKEIIEYNLEQKNKYLKEIEITLENIEKYENEKELTTSKIDQLNSDINEINNYCIKQKKIVYLENDTDYLNVVCKKCKNNCDINCNCNNNMLINCICYQLITGTCKICNHGVLHHSKVHYIYEQYEEEIYENDKDQILDYEKKEIQNLENKRKDEENYIFMINNILDNITIQLDEMNNKKINALQKVNECEEQNRSIEIEIIKILDKIKKNLDYLRKNSLNKEFTKTLEEYIEELIQEAEGIQEKEKSKKLKIFKKIYSQLIEVENLDISQLTNEKYEIIKNNILLND